MKKFLDTNSLPKNYCLEGIYSLIINGSKEEYFIIYNEINVFFVNKGPAKYSFMYEDEPGISIWQFQMPIKALSWMIDCIENGFWKKPSEGGFDQDVLHVDNIFEEEKIRIRFTPNCGSYNFPGITIKNYSIPWNKDHYSEMQLSYELLRSGGLLDSLKRVTNT